MAQKKSILTDKNKKILAGIFGGAFVVVFVYQFFLSDSGAPSKPSAASAPKPAGSVAPAASSTARAPSHSTEPVSPALGPEAARQAALNQLLSDNSPLDLAAVKSVKVGEATARGNMFEFHKEPPPPAPTPPPPPPIAVRYLEPQTAIAGTPKTITLKVTGASFPADPQIIFNGLPKETKRISETVLAVDLQPGDYSTQRNCSVEVKSKSDPVKLFSNQIPFMVQPAPLPPFKNIGRIGDLAVFEFGEGNNKEYKRMRRGQTIEANWRIDAITDTGVDVTDVRYDIKKHIPLEERKK
ncbi:MAG TPA: hypothetical protein VLZ81_10145 [Blastocatellia bacterium]|nr:hypothetical protein [Blastocatellia bacterium]